MEEEIFIHHPPPLTRVHTDGHGTLGLTDMALGTCSATAQRHGGPRQLCELVPTMGCCLKSLSGDLG